MKSSEMVKPWCRNLSAIFLTAVIAASAFSTKAEAMMGGTSSGGGDSYSPQIRQLISIFGGDHTQLTSDLVQVATNISKGGQNGVVSTEILNLIQKGLIDDFKAATYDLEQKCVDENGIEKSASTQKVDLSANPNQPRPSVCINVRKLAEENASYANLVGLMFHEHSRHFGMEDTTNLDLHPIADFVAERFTALSSAALSHASSANGVTVMTGGNGSDDFDSLGLVVPSYTGVWFAEKWIPALPAVKVMVPNTLDLSKQENQPLIVVDSLDGNCKGAAIFRYGEDNPDKQDLAPGKAINITSRYSAFAMYLKSGVLDSVVNNSPLSFFTEGRHCSVAYHIELQGVTSSKITTVLMSNPSYPTGDTAEEAKVLLNNIIYVYPESYLEDLN